MAAAAPSVPPNSTWLASACGAVAVAVPRVATASWLGPRRADAPLFTALARLAQNAAGLGAWMLSKTSGVSPGDVSVRRQVAACEPAASRTEMVLPSVPVKQAVSCSGNAPAA